MKNKEDEEDSEELKKMVGIPEFSQQSLELQST